MKDIESMTEAEVEKEIETILRSLSAEKLIQAFEMAVNAADGRNMYDRKRA